MILVIIVSASSPSNINAVTKERPDKCEDHLHGKYFNPQFKYTNFMYSWHHIYVKLKCLVYLRWSLMLPVLNAICVQLPYEVHREDHNTITQITLITAMIILNFISFPQFIYCMRFTSYASSQPFLSHLILVWDIKYLIRGNILVLFCPEV